MTKSEQDLRLNAYLDGELDAKSQREIEHALAFDPELRARLVSIAQTNGLLRGALNLEQMPDALHDKVSRILDQAPSPATPNVWKDRFSAFITRLSRTWLPAAAIASLLALAISLPFADYLAEKRSERMIAALEAARIENDRVLAEAVSNALERHRSGSEVDWRAPSGKGAVVVVPLRTFRNGDGRWCREYRLIAELSGEMERRRGIACREEGGRWQTRLSLAAES